MKKIYAAEEQQTPFSPETALKPFRVVFMIVPVIMLIKMYAYVESGAVSMLGSFIDSLGDIFISIVSYYSIKLSIKPADEEHRFGHGKAEGFSALFQSSFLFGSAVFLILETVRRLFSPVDISQHTLGISISLLSILLSFIIIFVQNQALKQVSSLALEADKKHYGTDILLNIAVIAVFAADLWSGLHAIDYVIGFVIALFIMHSAYEITMNATDMLMDKEISDDERQKIIDIVAGHKDVLSMHDLRTRRAGMHLYISFDVELEADLTLEKAHAITRDLDLMLLKEFPNAEILIHKDPKGDTYDPRHKIQNVHHR